MHTDVVSTAHGGIMKRCLFKYIKNFTTKKWKFSDKDSVIFHISAQNIDCEYLLEEYPHFMFFEQK